MNIDKKELRYVEERQNETQEKREKENGRREPKNVWRKEVGKNTKKEKDKKMRNGGKWGFQEKEKIAEIVRERAEREMKNERETGPAENQVERWN